MNKKCYEFLEIEVTIIFHTIVLAHGTFDNKHQLGCVEEND